MNFEQLSGWLPPILIIVIALLIVVRIVQSIRKWSNMSNTTLSAFTRFFTDGLNPSSVKSYTLYTYLSFIAFMVVALAPMLSEIYTGKFGIPKMENWLFNIWMSIIPILFNLYIVFLIIQLIMKRLSKKDRLHLINQKSSMGWWMVRLLLLFSPSLYVVISLWMWVYS